MLLVSKIFIAVVCPHPPWTSRGLAKVFKFEDIDTINLAMVHYMQQLITLVRAKLFLFHVLSCNNFAYYLNLLAIKMDK